MYKIFMLNFGWYSSEEFDDLDDAIAHAKSNPYQVRIDNDVDGEVTAIASYCRIRGLKYF